MDGREGDQQDADWSVYLGDPGRRHYTTLKQINRDNVHQLELAWVYKSSPPRGTMYTSPLVRRAGTPTGGGPRRPRRYALRRARAASTFATIPAASRRGTITS